MTFIAQLRKFSRVWRHWREGNRVGGVLYGAQFFWAPGNVYYSGPLTPDQLAALRSHPDIDIEAFGTNLPGAAPIPTALPAAPTRAPAPFVAPPVGTFDSRAAAGVSQPRRR